MRRQLVSSPGGEFSAGAAAKRCAIAKRNRPRNLDWAEGCEKPFPQRGPSFLSDRSKESEPASSGQFSLSQLDGGDTARHPPSGLLPTRRGSSEQLGPPSICRAKSSGRRVQNPIRGAKSSGSRVQSPIRRAKNADGGVRTPKRGPQSPARQPPGPDDGAKSVMVLLQKAARAEQKASRLALGARCARLEGS